MKQRPALIATLLLLLAIPAMAQDPTLLQPGDRVLAHVLDVTDGDSLVVEVRGLLLLDDRRLAGDGRAWGDVRPGVAPADGPRIAARARIGVRLQAAALE